VREVNDRHKWLLIAVVTISLFLVPMIAIGILYHSSPAQTCMYSSGHGETFPPASAIVDEALSPYVRIKTVGGPGGSEPGYSWNIVTGNVSWVGSPEDSVKSLHNIHLAVYTRLDENESGGKNTYMLVLGTHIEANLTEPTLPVDVIDHQEVIIPTIGLSTPIYQYIFNCSYFVK
jgi:hypothetical protein